MDTKEATRSMALHLLEASKGLMTKDTHSHFHRKIAKAPSKKVFKHVHKFVKHFKPAIEDMSDNPIDALRKVSFDGDLADTTEMDHEEALALLNGAKLCVSVSAAVHAMPKDALEQVEQMAMVLKEQIGDDIVQMMVEGMQGGEVDTEEVTKKVISAVGNSLGEDGAEGLKSIMSSIGGTDGMDKDSMQLTMNKVLPQMMNAIGSGKRQSDPKELLEKWAAIQ